MPRARIALSVLCLCVAVALTGGTNAGPCTSVLSAAQPAAAKAVANPITGDGNFLESRCAHGHVSGIFIKGNQVYAIDSESGPLNHPNWRNGVRIGPLDEDRITAFIPPTPASGPPSRSS